jgi:hypothetical protein
VAIAGSETPSSFLIAESATKPCTLGPGLHENVALSAILPPWWAFRDRQTAGNTGASVLERTDTLRSTQRNDGHKT